MTSKESCPVWGGAVGKVPGGQLAGRLLYAQAGFLLKGVACFGASVGVECVNEVIFMGGVYCVEPRFFASVTRAAADWRR